MLSVRHLPYDETYNTLQRPGIGKQCVCLAHKSLNLELLHPLLVKMLAVNLAVYHLGPSPLAGPPAFIEIAEVGIVTEAADKMKAVLSDSLVECAVREERVSHYQVRQLQKFLAVSLDDTDVVLRERLVAHLQLRGARSLMGSQHHAVVGIEVDKSQSHDFQSALYRTCTSRPETTDMRSLLACLADEARIYCYGHTSNSTEVAEGKRDVEAEPVDAHRTLESEVLAIALFTVPAIPAQLGEVLPSWYNHV